MGEDEKTVYPLFDYLVDGQNLIQNPPKSEERMIPSFDGINKSTFKTKMQSIDRLSDMEIMHLIKDNLDMIINDVLRNDKSYKDILLNKRFIMNLVRVMCSIPINHLQRVFCNKVFYDYRVSDLPIDEEISQSFFNLSMVANKDLVQQLIAIGLDEITACTLAMCRFSSTKERINAERLNFVIEQQDPDLMKEQMIIWIYEKLFSSITDLFIATMLEAYNAEDQLKLGENFMDIYGEVGLAVLTILNNMPLDSIRKVLISYACEWEYNGKYEVRFSLRSLSEDYSRISQVVSNLLAEGYYQIP